MHKVCNWLKKEWPFIPVLIALILLAIALLNEFSNFVNLAWFALVALTAIYAYATLRVTRAASEQTQETKRMIDEMKQARLDAIKPLFSLQPEGFTFGGGFSFLNIRNSGGVAKNLKVDMKINKTILEKRIFIPALNKDNLVHLNIKDIDNLLNNGGLFEAYVIYEDDYGQSFEETLTIDFTDIIKEGRELNGQTSSFHKIERILENIERHISQISR